MVSYRSAAVASDLLTCACFSRHNHQSVVAAALRVVGNIVTGDDCQTQVCICKLSWCGNNT